MPDYSCFTERGYRSILAAAKEKYAFLSYADALSAASGVLWRHDIDFSVHRAYALASIEHEMGVRATYFVELHGEFYSALEKQVALLIRKIAALGHDIGLHFDPSFYDITPPHSHLRRLARLEECVKMDKAALEDMLGVSVAAFSFHNPDSGGNWHELELERAAGLVSAYAPSIRRNYKYCSDSNGYWRFTPLPEVLAEGHERLQVLTHPAWWTPEPMPPRARVERCIMGRARAQGAEYDDALEKLGRENIR